MPTISVIIPAYNHGKELPGCLNSVFSQTFKNLEVLVVNDGSTDITEEILKKYRARKECSANFQIISQANQGAPMARNNGFKKSHGEYVIFLDADIKLKKDALEIMLNTLNDHPNASYTYSAFKFGLKKFPLFPFDAVKLRQCNYIHTSALIRREHFPKNGFDPSLKKFQDWDLWLTMLKEGHTGIWIPKILFTLKPRKKGMSEWIPSFLYKINWKKFGIRIKSIDNYEKWREIVWEKHGIR